MPPAVPAESSAPRHPVPLGPLLTVLSLLAILLLSIHIPDDVIHGFDKTPVNAPYWILILVLLLCGVLLLRERLIGRIIILLGGLASMLMPWLHLKGRGYGDEFFKADGAMRYLWTLAALGAVGSMVVILVVREMVMARRRPGPAASPWWNRR